MENKIIEKGIDKIKEALNKGISVEEIVELMSSCDIPHNVILMMFKASLNEMAFETLAEK